MVDGCAEWVVLVVVVVGGWSIGACGGLVCSVAAVFLETSVRNVPVSPFSSQITPVASGTTSMVSWIGSIN